MKRLYLAVSLGILLLSGCETGGAMKKTSSLSGKGSTINHESAKLSSTELISYVYENKDAVLNATDCPKLSSTDWDALYSDLMDNYAPAEPVMKSINSCEGVMRILETTNYPLDRAARSSIEKGWLNGVVEEFDYSVSNPPKREHLTFQKCKDLYGDLNQAQWAQEITKGKNIPEATACYQALMMSSEGYIDAYNYGIYDGMQGLENLTEPKIDNGYNPGDSVYMSWEDQKEKDMAAVEHLSKEECEEIFVGYSDYEMQMLLVDNLDKMYDMTLSEEKRWEYELYELVISHCRELMD
jgi:hypothetical protein